jgi:hypothetical protein
MSRLLFITSAILLTVFASACGPKPDPNAQIRVAVEQTVAAIPTFTPYPPEIIPTPIGLEGIFCEYQFCIGHPADMALYDVIAKQNPGSPAASKFDDGILAANNTSLFIQIIWQNAAGTTDPQFLLDLILDDRVDTRSGNLEPLLVGSLNVLYVSIATTATPVLPYGGAAAWTCGGRAFAWKTYTPQPDLAKNLLLQAIEKFRCNG